MNYAEISKETISLLYQSYNSLKKSPLTPSVRVLVELRTSQINGCDYCCKLHTHEAKVLGVSQEKMDTLTQWQTSELFTDQERAALQWAQELTILKGDVKKSVEYLSPYFSEREIVDLTTCISIMNALNRLAMSLKD